MGWHGYPAENAKGCGILFFIVFKKFFVIGGKYKRSPCGSAENVSGLGLSAENTASDAENAASDSENAASDSENEASDSESVGSSRFF